MAVTYDDDNQEARPEGAERSTPLNRMRWATTRKPGKKGVQKRRSIFQRNMARMSNLSGNRQSAVSDASDIKADEIINDKPPEGQTSRTIYFNQPLPQDARDEEGHPLQTFKRNKIRTAKYTPISFVPKNLWFQFHNIANVYFLFIVILGVRIAGKQMVMRWLTNDAIDLLNLRSHQPGPCGGAYHCYSGNHGHQGRH